MRRSRPAMTASGCACIARPGLPFHPVVGDAALIRRDAARASRTVPVFDLYSFYLEPETDVASFAPAMELGASFGAKYATVMGADTDWSRQRDNFITTCDLAQAIRPHLLARIRRDPPARDLAADRAAHHRGEARGRDLHRPAASGALRRHAGRREGARSRNTSPTRRSPTAMLEPGEPNPALFGKLGLGQRAMPGEGTLPLREILAALPKRHSAQRRVAALARAAWHQRTRLGEDDA